MGHGIGECRRYVKMKMERQDHSRIDISALDAKDE